MSDVLDRLITPGRDLLARVDTAIADGGVPPGHPLVPLLRRVGVLPGEALEFIAGLDPDRLTGTVIELRALADRYSGHRTAISAAVGSTSWQGAGATAFTLRWNALGEHLGDGESAHEPSMAGRIVAMISYLEELGVWMTATRVSVAGVLCEALGSAEAVRVRSGHSPAGHGVAGSIGPGMVSGIGGLLGVGEPAGGHALAAATIGLRVLRAADAAISAGHRVSLRWLPRLGEVPFTPPKSDQPGGAEAQVVLPDAR